MAELQHLRAAPIVEALIDVRIEARPEFRADAFHALRSQLEAEFPTVEERRGVTLQLAFGGPQPEEVPQQIQHGLDGLFFRSEDGRNIAQFRGDGFTYNRLPLYTSWSEILPQALRLLELYLQTTVPRSITRVATRYINRLQLPSPRLAEYLTLPPRQVPGIEGTVAGYMEGTLTAASAGSMVNFTQALEGRSSESDLPSVLIDIDAFHADSFAPDSDEVARRLNVLHDLKNRVFFGVLTEAAVSLYR